VVDVVVDVGVPVKVPVVNTLLKASTISVVYVDFKVSSMVVMKVSMLPRPNSLGVYSTTINTGVISIRGPF
jgi:hypothetical protein